jgi:hypothetical protein
MRLKKNAVTTEIGYESGLLFGVAFVSIVFLVIAHAILERWQLRYKDRNTYDRAKH